MGLGTCLVRAVNTVHKDVDDTCDGVRYMSGQSREYST